MIFLFYNFIFNNKTRSIFIWCNLLRIIPQTCGSLIIYLKYKYQHLNHKIYNYVLKNAISGINKLINTYSSCDRQSITHTLSLYKNILDLENPELFKNEEEDSQHVFLLQCDLQIIKFCSITCMWKSCEVWWHLGH